MQGSPIVSREEWLIARKALLVREKAAKTRVSADAMQELPGLKRLPHGLGQAP